MLQGYKSQRWAGQVTKVAVPVDRQQQDAGQTVAVGTSRVGREEGGAGGLLRSRTLHTPHSISGLPSVPMLLPVLASEVASLASSSWPL